MHSPAPRSSRGIACLIGIALVLGCQSGGSVAERVLPSLIEGTWQVGSTVSTNTCPDVTVSVSASDAACGSGFPCQLRGTFTATRWPGCIFSGLICPLGSVPCVG